MRKFFEDAQVELILFAAQDILTTSSPTGNAGGGTGGGNNGGEM